MPFSLHIAKSRPNLARVIGPSASTTPAPSRFGFCEGFQMLAGRDGVAGCTAGV